MKRYHKQGIGKLAKVGSDEALNQVVTSSPGILKSKRLFLVPPPRWNTLPWVRLLGNLCSYTSNSQNSIISLLDLLLSFIINNNGAMALSSDPVDYAQNKHINVYHYFIQEKSTDNSVDIWHVDSTDNISNIMTKTLGHTLFERHCKALGVW